MNSALIYVVEDEPSIGEAVGMYLRRAGYLVISLTDGKSAIEALERQFPDLIVLDLMLPGVDGLEISRWVRERSDLPIIMLTARREEVDRIAGLELGADDYVIKPFSPQELVSRVRAVLRRSRHSSHGTLEVAVVYANLRIDPSTRLVSVRDVEINLTAKEFNLLWYMARHPQQVFTRDQLLESVWGLSDYIDPGTVTVHVRRLRQKIETDPANPQYIQTVWGMGYKFEP